MLQLIWNIANGMAFLVASIFRPFRQHRSKVLHVSNFSHKPYILTRKLREQGIQADLLALNIDWTYLNMGEQAFDYGLESTDRGKFKYYLKAFYIIWFVMTRYDIIHIHGQSSLTYRLKEYLHLKRLGGKLIFHFRGCDIRQKDINNEKNPTLNCCQECDYPDGSCCSEQQRRYVEIVKKTGDAFFATTPDLLDFAPQGTVLLPFVLPPQDLIDSIVPVERNKDIFRVVTSSNHDGVDGTEYVRKAVKDLQQEGTKIELVEVKKTPFKEALSIYASADLYAGKLRMGYYNNANIECMLLGVPCMSYIRPEFRKAFAPDCPIIQTEPSSIYDLLKEYSSKKAELKEIGRNSREFVLREHCGNKSLKPLVDIYQEMLTT